MREAAVPPIPPLLFNMNPHHIEQGTLIDETLNTVNPDSPHPPNLTQKPQTVRTPNPSNPYP